MYEIDRMVVILKPTKEFLEWVNNNKEDEGEPYNLEELQADSTALLIPLFDDKLDAEEFISEIYLDLFENELSAWTLDEETWPEPITVNLFKEWFELEFHSLVLDTVETEQDFAEVVEETVLQ